MTFVNTRAALRLRVTQNIVLRRMVRPEKVEIHLYSVERGDLYSSAEYIVMMK